MILFDLLCSQGHRFEAWFRDSDSFDRLVAVGEIHCALCGDTDVRKALMAPNISASKSAEGRVEAERAEEATYSNSKDDSPETTADAASSPHKAMVVQDKADTPSSPAHPPMQEKMAEAMRVLRQVQSHIEKNFDHVGKRFAEEARKMHYGEAEKRSIYGEATKNEAEELVEEGIEIDQMPWLPPRNS